MKRALFGGTFDPIHRAHVEVARAAADAFGFDQILMIPAANPPHKQGAATPFEHRYRMVELACAGDPRLVPSRAEEGLERSYSILTIERLKKDGKPLYFIIGADAFADIEIWHRAKEVIASVEFVVVSRPGHTYDIPAGAKVHRLETLHMPISSSDIRGAIARGEMPADIPPAVADYIRKEKLYR
ncbi:MAG: nicotinate (nicotinamide) nucleotide adenylyltransferase [Acidobacteriota bacterium]